MSDLKQNKLYMDESADLEARVEDLLRNPSLD